MSISEIPNQISKIKEAGLPTLFSRTRTMDEDDGRVRRTILKIQNPKSDIPNTKAGLPTLLTD